MLQLARCLQLHVFHVLARRTTSMRSQQLLKYHPAETESNSRVTYTTHYHNYISHLRWPKAKYSKHFKWFYVYKNTIWYTHISFNSRWPCCIDMMSLNSPARSAKPLYLIHNLVELLLFFISTFSNIYSSLTFHYKITSDIFIFLGRSVIASSSPDNVSWRISVTFYVFSYMWLTQIKYSLKLIFEYHMFNIQVADNILLLWVM